MQVAFLYDILSIPFQPVNTFYSREDSAETLSVVQDSRGFTMNIKPRSINTVIWNI